jgi:hypothetical protein
MIAQMIRAVLFAIRDGGDPCGLSRKQIRQPWIAFGILPCTTHKRRHADNATWRKMAASATAEATYEPQPGRSHQYHGPEKRSWPSRGRSW